MSILAQRRSIMTLYSEPTDPVGHSVRVVVADKDINVEINYVDADDLPEDLIALNPYNAALTLVDRELVLYDAQIMMEYLDERFPHPPLLPVDPITRANNRQLRYRIVNDLYSLLGDLTGTNDIAAANARKALKDNLTSIAPAFAQHEYFMSSEYTLVDCCMAPILWRLEHYAVKLPPQAKLLRQYGERLFARPSFQTSLSDAEREIREGFFVG